MAIGSVLRNSVFKFGDTRSDRPGKVRPTGNARPVDAGSESEPMIGTFELEAKARALRAQWIASRFGRSAPKDDQ